MTTSGAAIVKPAHRLLATSTNQPSTGIGLLSLIASVKPRAQMNVASVAMMALSPSLATRNPWNRPMMTPTPMAASTANVNEADSDTRPRTIPCRASTEPTDKSMLREMIEKVSGTATRARAADCDTIVWTRLRLTHTGLMTANVQNAPTVRTVNTQRSALPRAATAQLHRAPRRSRRSTTTASRRTPPIIACWRFGGTPRIVW